MQLKVRTSKARTSMVAVAVVALLLCSVETGAVVVYSHEFNGSSADLHGTAPDVGPGALTWVASPVFNQDGSIDANNAGSATLAFTPTSGHRYQLDARFSNITGDNDWFALGYANGQSTGSTAGDRFITTDPTGMAWMLYRGDASVNTNTTFLGDTSDASNPGTNAGLPWDAFANQSGGDIDMRILLDTTGGAGAWTATYLAKRPTDASYTQVRPATTLLDEAINSVGVARSSGDVDGAFEFFALEQLDNNGVYAPYTPDANTLHLWHLDEPNPGPAQPAPDVTGSFNLTPVNGATLGAPSFINFGTAGNVSGGDSNDGLMGNNIPVSQVTGADGAFTFEAIVNTSTIESVSGSQQIISMEAPGGVSARPFQFRINNGDLEFINIAGGNVEVLAAAIPTSGEDAFAPGEWFHAAVAYNGEENTADNLQLYWTALNGSATEAHLIFSGSMSSDIMSSAVLGIGNEFRSPSENLEGFIDEVRISNIARGANDFLFASAAVPEPGTAALAMLGLGGLALRRRRRSAVA